MFDKKWADNSRYCFAEGSVNFAERPIYSHSQYEAEGIGERDFKQASSV